MSSGSYNLGVVPRRDAIFLTMQKIRSVKVLVRCLELLRPCSAHTPRGPLRQGSKNFPFARRGIPATFSQTQVVHPVTHLVLIWSRIVVKYPREELYRGLSAYTNSVNNKVLKTRFLPYILLRNVRKSTNPPLPSFAAFYPK